MKKPPNCFQFRTLTIDKVLQKRRRKTERGFEANSFPDIFSRKVASDTHWNSRQNKMVGKGRLLSLSLGLSLGLTSEILYLFPLSKSFLWLGTQMISRSVKTKNLQKPNEIYWKNIQKECFMMNRNFNILFKSVLERVRKLLKNCLKNDC
jgi:hypothetical protein